MSNRLYIIGNGFDLHHKIPSSYWHFGQYLKVIDSDTYGLIEQFIGIDDLFWNEFESRLSGLDSDHLLEDMSGFLASYGDDDWSDAGHHTYQYEVGRVVGILSAKLLSHFSDWIRQLSIPSRSDSNIPFIHLDLTAQYLSFNYTNTLQKTYGVPDANVLHIHGVAIDSTSDLILGHAYELTNKDPYRYEANPEDADIRVIEAISIIDDYFEKTFKNTEVMIEKHKAFFEGLTSVTEIHIYGHSLEDVDEPYFEKIMASIDSSKVKWVISYYGDLPRMKEKANGLNIDLTKTSFVQLQDL